MISDLGDAAAGDGGAVGLDRETHPGGRRPAAPARGNVCATNGRMSTSTTAKITTSDDTSTGTIGRARMAPPVAIAAETPQIEMPDASGAAHSRLKPNHLRATK